MLQLASIKILFAVRHLASVQSPTHWQLHIAICFMLGTLLFHRGLDATAQMNAAGKLLSTGDLADQRTGLSEGFDRGGHNPSASDSADELSLFEESRQLMGVVFTIKGYCEDVETAQLAFEDAFAQIKRIEKLFSDYDPNSHINQLFDTGDSVEYVPLCEELAPLFQRSHEIAQATDNAFDYALGNLTRLWRKARHEKRLPSPEETHAAKQSSGLLQIEYDPATKMLKILNPAVRFDFGGIGKGYAADVALSTLRHRGVTRALINAAGDLSIGDPPPNSDGWKIGFRATPSPRKQPLAHLKLANCGIATSGDEFHFVLIDGKRYSHIIDPQTGLGMLGHRQVTVIAKDGTTADALASAMNVLDPHKIETIIERFPGTMIYVWSAVDPAEENFDANIEIDTDTNGGYRLYRSTLFPTIFRE
ncbi:MAG TPA: FAD:protein FMN transferase [Pirellulaceae bacterium]|nr:FAD:protein FMN transferase [Pirellulaceae bacterium]HMO90714.1 FAD:protein FMN transferase [Pirellulaceae bacterium]HMP71080.1 FAD:protein FMN transferase [Pirellulaceae bacterium]